MQNVYFNRERYFEKSFSEEKTVTIVYEYLRSSLPNNHLEKKHKRKRRIQLFSTSLMILILLVLRRKDRFEQLWWFGLKLRMRYFLFNQLSRRDSFIILKLNLSVLLEDTKDYVMPKYHQWMNKLALCIIWKKMQL